MTIREKITSLRSVAVDLMDCKPGIAKEDRECIGAILRDVLDELEQQLRDAALAMDDA